MKQRSATWCWACAAATALLAWLMLAAPSPAPAQTAEAVDHTALRVCADPNNLPFSNDQGQGFENKIAELLAAELGVPVRYTWFPNSVGFVRNTLRARKCDLIIGTLVGDEMVQNTNPYYRTVFCLIYRTDSGLSIRSLDDPALKDVTIGVIAGTPPVNILAANGLLRRLHSYQLVVDTRFEHPAEELVADIASGEVDVGILWGPFAGYLAKKHGQALAVVPLAVTTAPIRLDYRITMGLRHNEPEWKRTINDLLRKKQAEINSVLTEYGVPLLDEKGEQIAP